MAETLKPEASSLSWCAPYGRRASVLLMIGLMATALAVPAGDEQKTKSKLLFLVAREQIEDPMFEHSVVLMLPTQQGPLVVGLIVNKPSRLSMLKFFPQSPTQKDHPGMAYVGGPVDMETPALVFHSSKPPKQAMPLYDDVYLSFDGDFIEGLMADRNQTGEVRLYLGRAQWAPQQLQGEGLEGSWDSLRAEGEVIFDRDSAHLWDRLHNRASPALKTENWTARPVAGHRLASPARVLPSL